MMNEGEGYEFGIMIFNGGRFAIQRRSDRNRNNKHHQKKDLMIKYIDQI